MQGSADRWTGYFSELDPEKRLAILNETKEKDDCTAAFLTQLYEERYHDPRRPGAVVDTWLWKLVYLPGLYRRRRISKGAFRREVERTLPELHLTDTLTEENRQALCLEYRNTARRFLGTCLGRRYASRLFGMKEADLEEKKQKACEEIWMASRGIALSSGKEEVMQPFCEALREELAVFYPGYQKIYNRLEQQFARK